MNQKNHLLRLATAGLLGGVIALGGYKVFLHEPNFQTIEQKQHYQLSKFYSDTTNYVVPEGMNFIASANLTRPAVVHIKTYYDTKSASISAQPLQLDDPFLKHFFGEGMIPQNNIPKESSGSGVIITKDGYIVTNNHVIDKADKIKVVLDDKRSYEAKLIGKDPSTDLAVLKIDNDNLHFVRYGNSDVVKVGEWVLAVGNPFDLTSTVTAGIVSAKARNINILRSKENMAIESFIQTDAAVNPGNSGGALVNLKGELIGINTAIATPNGTFTGYSFAVPVNIVKKVIDDLMQYGEVQRALLGINIQDITAELAQEKNIKDIKGVYIAGINAGSAAADAGIEEGDIITQIDNQQVNTSSELQEVIGRHRPGDKVKVNYRRKGIEKSTLITLKNKNGNLEVVKAKPTTSQILGAEFESISDQEKKQFKTSNGVKITRLIAGKLKTAGIKEGYIITMINKKPVTTAKEIFEIVGNTDAGGILIDGIEPDGKTSFYAIGL